MMLSDHIFEKKLTDEVLKCLQMFEIITKNAEHIQDYECFDQGYYEQPYENENNYYQQQSN